MEADWSSIRAVAEGLLGKRKLSAVDLKAIILRCERDLDSS